MNANDLLRGQHQEVEQKYNRFKQATGKAKEELGKDILTDLTAHAETEEELYYPELEQAGKRDAVAEYRAEHAEMKTLISQLSGMDAAGADYAPTMKALMETVLHHAQEEEQEGMPEAERILGKAKLGELGIKMEKRFAELKGSALKRLLAAMT